MKSRRVLHVYKDIYPPVAGGIERHIDSIRRSVPGWRHDVLVAAHGPHTFRRETEYGIETHVGGLGRLLSTPLAPAFPWRLRTERRGALVHLHMPNPTGEASMVLGGGRGPTVATYHCDIFRQRVLLPLYRPLVVRCLRSADAVVVGSAELAGQSPLIRAAGVPTTVIPYAVDVEQWMPERVKAEAVARLHAHYGAEHVLAVGRLVSYKGFDRLIALARRLTLPVVIVGDGPLRGELETLIEREGVRDRVHLAGRVSDEQLATHLAAAAIFVLPSVNRAESFGISTLEAQAAGLPVVVTDVGTGTSEAFAPGESGLLVPSGSDEAMVHALNDLAAEPARRRAMGEAGRRRVAERNSFASLGAELGALYAKVSHRWSGSTHRAEG